MTQAFMALNYALFFLIFRSDFRPASTPRAGGRLVTHQKKVILIVRFR